MFTRMYLLLCRWFYLRLFTNIFNFLNQLILNIFSFSVEYIKFVKNVKYIFVCAFIIYTCIRMFNRYTDTRIIIATN